MAAPFISHAGFNAPRVLLGCAVGGFGLVGLLLSYRALGRSHSPWTRPIEGARLVTTGPYALVRHPVYTSYVAIGLGLELATGSVLGVGFVVAAFIYYDLRTREEDKWLAATYADFDHYRHQVRGRLIPGVY